MTNSDRDKDLQQKFVNLLHNAQFDHEMKYGPFGGHIPTSKDMEFVDIDFDFDEMIEEMHDKMFAAFALGLDETLPGSFTNSPPPFPDFESAGWDW